MSKCKPLEGTPLDWDALIGAQDPNEPDFLMASLKAQHGETMIVRDVFAGTLRLRARGRDYLPQFPKEPDDDYDVRLQQAILAARGAIAGLYMDQKVVDYIVDLVRATRDPASVGLLVLKPLIAFGGSPRASIALAQAGRAHAFLRARNYVVPEDVRALAPDVLRHRIVLTFEAEAEDVTTDDVVARVLGAVKVP